MPLHLCVVHGAPEGIENASIDVSSPQLAQAFVEVFRVASLQIADLPNSKVAEIARHAGTNARYRLEGLRIGLRSLHLLDISIAMSR